MSLSIDAGPPSWKKAETDDASEQEHSKAKAIKVEGKEPGMQPTSIDRRTLASLRSRTLDFSVYASA
jgi:hypothetical protein